MFLGFNGLIIKRKRKAMNLFEPFVSGRFEMATEKANPPSKLSIWTNSKSSVNGQKVVNKLVQFVRKPMSFVFHNYTIFIRIYYAT